LTTLFVPPAPIILLTIDFTKAFVDSGAQISRINERFLNVTSFRNYKAQKTMVKSIIGARGTNHVVKGQINLPFI
jgi:hypothetical protein